MAAGGSLPGEPGEDAGRKPPTETHFNNLRAATESWGGGGGEGGNNLFPVSMASRAFYGRLDESSASFALSSRRSDNFPGDFSQKALQASHVQVD